MSAKGGKLPPVSREHSPRVTGGTLWKRWECTACGMPFKNQKLAVQHQVKMQFISNQAATSIRLARQTAGRKQAEAKKKSDEAVAAAKAREEKVAEEKAWIKAELEEAMQTARDEGHAEGKWEAVSMIEKAEQEILDMNSELIRRYGMNSTGMPKPGTLRPDPEKLAELRGAAMVLSKLLSDLRDQGWRS